MAIMVNLDVVMAQRKMTLSQLSEQVDITLANLSILKNNKAKAVRFSTLEAICAALDCQPGDILEYIPDEIPNDETLDSFSEIETGNGTHFKGNTKDLFQNLQESED